MKLVMSQILFCIAALAFLCLVELDDWYKRNYVWPTEIEKAINKAYPFSTKQEKYYELFNGLKK